MARLGGISTESFSSARDCLCAASVGLAAILRDQKTMPGSSRTHVLLGLSSQTIPATARSLSDLPAWSRANSPIESSGLLDGDDADDQKEGDICGGADPKENRNFQALKESLGVSGDTVSYELNDAALRRGFSPARTQPHQTHMLIHHQRCHSRSRHDVSTLQMYAVEGAWPTRHRLVDKQAGLCDSIVSTSAVAVRFSPLSNIAEMPTRQALQSTPSWPIPSVRRRTCLDAADASEHQSAPMNVPNWSKRYKSPSSRSHGVRKSGENESDRLPPHELLAREFAQSQRMTSSVCEGHGRTLKGRDMRRVRNEVWRQSGFAD